MVYHGGSFSGQYPNTTWPGIAAFSYYYSEAWSRHQPAFDNGFLEMNDFVARTQWILQAGQPQVDVAFWNKLTTGNISAWSLENDHSDLETAG